MSSREYRCGRSGEHALQFLGSWQGHLMEDDYGSYTLHEWLIQTRAKTANGGGSAKALDYTLKRWPS